MFLEKVFQPPAAFKRLVWSNLTAQFAEQIGLVAAPMVAVLVLHANAAETGLLQAIQTLPFLLLSLPAGVLVDRVSRRRIMVHAEALRATSLFCILVLFASGLLSLPLLAILGFVGAASTVAYSVAAPSLVPALVPREMLTIANGRVELARSSAFAAGPAAAGALVGWIGIPVAYAMATAISIFAVCLLAGLTEPTRPVSVRKHVLHDLRDGASFVLTHALLRPMLLTSIIFNVSWFILQAIYVLYAVRELGLSASVVGITLGIYGIGMVLGAIVAPLIAKRLPFGATLALGPLSALAGALVMVLTIRVPSALLAGLSFFLFGVGPIIWTVTSTTLRQAITPSNMLGRASALIMMATFGARPVGAAIGALIGSRYGIEACVVVAAIGFFVQFVVISVSSVSRLSVLPEMATGDV
ncbi:MAG: MFS transporter [Gammaproteobacteria bacterium]|nr:MFS transporter [Gammaproteobacteria bacterium]